MVTYDARQWEKCKWNLSELSNKKSCLEEIPALREHFNPLESAVYKNADIGIPYEKMVRYIVLVYHRYSPYAIYQQDIVARKFDVCEFIGLDIKKTEIKKIIANQVEFVSYAALYFLKHEANIAWLELQVYLESYYQIMSALTDGAEPTGTKGAIDVAKSKLQVVKEMKVIKSEIDSLSAQIFNQDNDLLNHIERFKEVEKQDYVILSAEQFSKKMVSV